MNLGWSESEIKQGIKNIFLMYKNNIPLYEKEVRNRTVIILDYHNGGGTGCLLLTDNGFPYMEGIYYTFYSQNIYILHIFNQDGDIELFRIPGTIC